MGKLPGRASVVAGFAAVEPGALAWKAAGRIRIDFSKCDLDAPLPPLTTNGHQSSSAKWIGRTPRSIAHTGNSKQCIMAEVSGDGFLRFNAHLDRRYAMGVCDGLVRELLGRGLTRTGYPHRWFKDNLMEH